MQPAPQLPSGLFDPLVKEVGEIYGILMDHTARAEKEARLLVREFETRRGERERTNLQSSITALSKADAEIAVECQRLMHTQLEKLNEQLTSTTSRLAVISQKVAEFQVQSEAEKKKRIEALSAEKANVLSDIQQRRLKIDEQSNAQISALNAEQQAILKAGAEATASAAASPAPQQAEPTPNSAPAADTAAPTESAGDAAAAAN